MVAMKRQAKSPMKAAKKAKKDEVGPKITEVKDILSNSECDIPGPSGNRDMLVSALPYSLGDYSDVRHDYQKTVAKLIGEVMQGWVAKWEQKVADAKTHVDTTESDRVAADATQETAKGAVEGQKTDVKACKDALKEASSAEKEAKEALAKADGEVADFDKGLQKKIAEKDSVSMVYNQSFLAMKSAEGMAAKDAKDHLKKIVPVLKKISTESSLHIAISPALEKSPADRGQFDSMAISGVETAFKSAIEQMSTDISSQDATKSGLETKAAEAKAIHDAAEGKRQECIAALKASQEALEEKEKALAAAEKSSDAASKAANKALRTIAHEQRGLDHAKGNMATFTFLVERTTPPPPPPSPVEEEAPAEEAPAA